MALRELRYILGPWLDAALTIVFLLYIHGLLKIFLDFVAVNVTIFVDIVV